MRGAIAFFLFCFTGSSFAHDECSGLLSGSRDWRLLYSSPSRGDVIEVSGMPRSATAHVPERTEVFRYYVSNPEVFERILQERVLRAGVLPYVVSEPGLKKEYHIDLTGLFLTKPDFDPRHIGLGSNQHMHYVDFTVPVETKMIRLDAGIFLVPGKPAYPAWVLEAYQRWKQGMAMEVPGLPESVFRRMQERESLPELLIPITITGQR